jgi:hypothetical protein
MARRWFVPCVLLCAAFGGLLRFLWLDAQCLSIEEVWHYDMVKLSQEGGLLEVAKLDHVSPLSYWIDVPFDRAGLGPMQAVRVPQVLFGAGAIVLAGLLGRRMFRSEAVGLAAAGLTAISPFAVWHAQDARMYALLMFLTFAFLLVFWDMRTRSARWWHWVGLSLLAMAMVYTHHYGAFVSIACTLYLLWDLGPRDRRFWLFLLTQALAAISFLPWIYLTREAIFGGTRVGFPKGVVAMWLPYTLFVETFGYSFGPSIRELRASPSQALRRELPVIVLPVLAAAWCGLAGLRRVLRADDRAAGRLCLLVLAVPIALSIGLALVTGLTFNVRLASGAFPALVLILACGIIDTRWSRVTRAAAVVLVAGMGLSLYQWFTAERYAKEEIRGAVTHLRDAFRPGDILIVSSMTGLGPLTHYGFPKSDEIVTVGFHEKGKSESLTAALTLVEALGTQPAGKQVWLLEFRAWESDPKGLVRQRLDRLGKLGSQETWPGTTLRQYTIAGNSAEPPGPTP